MEHRNGVGRTLGAVALCGLLLTPYSTPFALASGITAARGGAAIARVAPPSEAIKDAPRWTRSFLPFGSALVTLAPFMIAYALPPAPGAPLPWQPAFPLYKGLVNLATGNLALRHGVAGWDALGGGVSFGLTYNSQSGRSGAMGARWSHSYESRILGTSPALVVRGDGQEISYTLASNVYTAPAGFCETLVRAADGTWTLTYKDGSFERFDSSGLLTSIQQIGGNATSLTYVGGQLTAVTDSAGRSLALAYSSGKLSSITDPEGRAWSFSYNTGARLSTVTDPVISGTAPVTSFSYNTNGLVTGITNRLNKTWTYAYGANGIFWTVTDPHNNIARTVHTAPTTLDSSGFSSQDTSTGAVDVPDANPASYPVDTVAIAYTQDAGGNAKEYGIDAQGRTTAMRNGSGHQTNLSWDTSNNLTQLTEPGAAITTRSFDARGNVTSTTDPTGKTTTNTYDLRNNLLTTTDPAGSTSSNAFDLHNNLLSATDATGRSVSHSYNSNDTLASTTDDVGSTTTYGYNAVGDQTSVTDPLGNTRSYVYTLGRVTRRTDALGRTTTLGYDSLLRVITVDYPQSVDQSFTYDLEGRMTQAVDGTGTRTYTYDDLGRKVQQTDPRGNTVATYDGASRLKSQTDVTGRLIQYAYNGDGQITGFSDPTTWTTNTYDARYRLVRTTNSTGITSLYGYDAADRTTSLVHKNAAGTIITSYNSTYDLAGMVAQTVEAPVPATTAYTYDVDGRPLGESRTGAKPYSTAYTYNARGLRATASRSEGGVSSHSATYSYDAAGQLTTVNDAITTSGLGGAYTWNADGTLASLPGPSFQRLLSYDEEGQLTAVSKLQNGVTTQLFQYGYGFDGGRRWRKDLVASVWDWYPCGVSCAAGELVTLRSTNGGGTWATLETKLSSGASAFVDGLPVLAGTTSGTIRVQGTSEQVVVDSFGVVRDGAFGPKLTSLARPLRGDAGLEPDLDKLQVALNSKERARCDKIYLACMIAAETAFVTCMAAVAAFLAKGLKICNVIPIPPWRVACLLALGLAAGGMAAACYFVREGVREECYNNRKDCYEKIKPPPKPKPIKPTPRKAGL